MNIDHEGDKIPEPGIDLLLTLQEAGELAKRIGLRVEKAALEVISHLLSSKQDRIIETIEDLGRKIRTLTSSSEAFTIRNDLANKMKTGLMIVLQDHFLDTQIPPKESQVPLSKFKRPSFFEVFGKNEKFQQAFNNFLKPIIADFRAEIAVLNKRNPKKEPIEAEGVLADALRICLRELEIKIELEDADLLIQGADNQTIAEAA